MFGYETEIYEKFNFVAGVDEVGRGCLFGDVYGASVIMDKKSDIKGIDDSKKLSPKKREELYEKILDECIAFGIGIGTVSEINKFNIKEASKMAMERAVFNLRTRDGEKIIPDLVMVDFETLNLGGLISKSIVHGDSLSYNIACASIIAKVVRDRKCIEWDREYPGYHIAKNKGYGTLEHRNAISELGQTELHREKFIRNLLRR